MAFIADDQNKLQDPNAQNAQGQSQDPSSGGGGDFVSGSGGGSSSAQSQPGTGGTGGWTNIQNYVQANQGQSGSAQALKDKVGGQFNQEQQNLDSDIQKQKDQATQANSADFSTSSAANAVKQYAGTQDQDLMNQYHGLLTKQYQMPTQPYGYGMSADTQQYGQDLSDDRGFGTLMNGIYNQAAGGQMSQGQFNLQNQFDVNNQDLSKARGDLSNQYNALKTNAGLAPQQLNDWYGQQATQFGQNQQGLKDYFDQTAGQDQGIAAYNPSPGKMNPQGARAAKEYAAIQSFLQGQNVAPNLPKPGAGDTQQTQIANPTFAAQPASAGAAASPTDPNAIDPNYLQYMQNNSYGG